MLIEYGDLVNCAIDEIGDVDAFVFSGTAGSTIRVQASRLRGDTPCFQVYGPDGVALDFARCGPRDYRLSQTGTHSILVTEASNDGTVDYALALEQASPPSRAARPVENGRLINDEINGIGDVDAFFFEGNEGGAVRVQATRRGGGTPCFQVFAPDGAALDFARCGPRDYQLSQTGTHTILITEASNDATVEYALVLVCSAADACEPLALPDVSGCIASRGAPLGNRRVTLAQPDEPARATRTDVRGCYAFPSVVAGKGFRVVVQDPPAADR